jgi:hypothetical protein
VFVQFRTVRGIYERSIRASGPLEAEQAAAMADPRILETLGAQVDRSGSTSDDRSPGYRRVQRTGWQRLRGKRRERSDGNAAPFVRVVEVVAPTR